MGSKAMNVFVLMAFTCLISTVLAKPRDSSRVEDPSVVPISQEVSNADITTKTESTAEMKSPGRIWCHFEEANEDAVCQEHCLPKGYSYGICVSHTCSCI